MVLNDYPKTHSSTEEVTNGQYPVSIGTSIPLETLFGINENIRPTNPLPYAGYSVIMINIRTLLRNITGAVNKELRQDWSDQQYFDKLLYEMTTIPDIVNDQSHGKLKVGFYYLTNLSIAKTYPNAFLKKSNSSSSLKSGALELYAYQRIKRMVESKELFAFLGDMQVPLPDDSRSLILSHLPIDLLPYADSRRVDLIESHTGVIKDKNAWYTKLSGKGLERIPFSKLMIQVFGDGKSFSGYPSKQRNTVLKFAEDNRWNQSTSDRVILKQLDRFPDKELAKSISNL